MRLGRRILLTRSVGTADNETGMNQCRRLFHNTDQCRLGLLMVDFSHTEVEPLMKNAERVTLLLFCGSEREQNSGCHMW